MDRKESNQEIYHPTFGPAFEKYDLQNSAQDGSAFRLPHVVQTPSLERIELPELNARKFTWRNLQTPPKIDFPKLVYLIDSLGDNFDSALEHLVTRDKVGVKLEGCRGINRSGELYTINISSKQSVYVFDVRKLKERCFKYGLKRILEDHNILKIFHDVRGSSDMLGHQYNVSLENVFDTAVADITFFSNNQTNRLMPALLKSYQSLCIEYLGIAKSCLSFQSIRTNNKEDDESIFWEESISKKMLLSLARNGMYLIPLEKQCKIALMSKFQMANDIFLNHLRDCNDYEAEKLTTKMEQNPQKVPQEIEDMYLIPEVDYQQEGESVERRFIHQDVGDYLPNAIFRF